MLNYSQIEKAWAKALREHATTEIQGAKGPYLPIGAKTLRLLDALWLACAARPALDVGAMLAEGKDVRVFSDPHFEHANIIHMCERPFETVEAMDEALWAGVERAMLECDLLLCLGDWAMKNPLSWAQRASALAPGRLAGVVGNHDVKGANSEQWALAGLRGSMAFSVESALARSWAEAADPELASAVDWSELPRIFNVGLSHWPVPPQIMPGPAWINLHGHVHNREDRPLRVNCSVEAIGYKPRSVSDMIGARVLDDLARRQRGLDTFDESSVSGEVSESML